MALERLRYSIKSFIFVPAEEQQWTDTLTLVPFQRGLTEAQMGKFAYALWLIRPTIGKLQIYII